MFLLLVCVLSLHRICHGEVLFWRPSVRWNDPYQWKDGVVPCAADAIHLPATQHRWRLDVKQPIAIKRLVLGGNAGIRFGPAGSGLHLLRAAGGCEDSSGSRRPGKKQRFVGAKLRNWGCASNWRRHDGSVPQQPPCGDDTAIFPANASIPWVHITRSIGVGQVLWQGTLLQRDNVHMLPEITNGQLVIERGAGFQPQCSAGSACPCYSSTGGCEPDAVTRDDTGVDDATVPVTVTKTPTTPRPVTTTQSLPTTPSAATSEVAKTASTSNPATLAISKSLNTVLNTAPANISIAKIGSDRSSVSDSLLVGQSTSTSPLLFSVTSPIPTSVIGTALGTHPSGASIDEAVANDADSSKGNNNLLLIVCAAASCLLVLIIALVVVFVYRRRHSKPKDETDGKEPKRPDPVYAEPKHLTGQSASKSEDSSTMLRASRKQVAEFQDHPDTPQGNIYSTPAAGTMEPTQVSHYDNVSLQHRDSRRSACSRNSSVPPPVPERRLSQATPTSSFFYSPLPGRRFLTPDLPPSQWRKMELSEFESREDLAPASPLPARVCVRKKSGRDAPTSRDCYARSVSLHGNSDCEMSPQLSRRSSVGSEREVRGSSAMQSRPAMPVFPLAVETYTPRQQSLTTSNSTADNVRYQLHAPHQSSFEVLDQELAATSRTTTSTGLYSTTTFSTPPLQQASNANGEDAVSLANPNLARNLYRPSLDERGTASGYASMEVMAAYDRRDSEEEVDDEDDSDDNDGEVPDLKLGMLTYDLPSPPPEDELHHSENDDYY